MEIMDALTEIATLENDILTILRHELGYLIGPDYDPDKNADHDLFDDDVEFFRNEINKIENRLKLLKHLAEKASQQKE